jgi:FAD-linked oxidoreductase
VPAARSRWRNWAGNQSCEPIAIHRPSSEDELVAIVRAAAARGERVKAVGAGHSFTGTALTDGHLVRLDRYARVLHVDRAAALVTVQAGIPLSRLNDELAAHGLAMENLGDIAYQSIAGAIATSTHGTGARFTGIAAQVRSMRVVTGEGAVAEVGPEAAVGVGALGLVSTVTLQCVPAFRLHAIDEPIRLDAVLEQQDDLVDGTDHFEYFWVPHTGWTLTKRNRRTDEPAQPRPRLRALRDDYLYGNVLFDLACRVGRRSPERIPSVMRKVPSAGRVEYTDRSDKVFASPRLTRFYEMEYAIPREHGADAVRAVRDYVKSSGLFISFPVEVRFTAADDVPLSTSTGRASCYVAVHVYKGMEHVQYFRAVESIMDELGGRPHWGKLHFQDATTLASRYPRWDEVQQLRRRLDPNGTFRNDYTDRVLGPIS